MQYSPLACFQKISGRGFISPFMRNGIPLAADNTLHIVDIVNSSRLVFLWLNFRGH